MFLEKGPELSSEKKKTELRWSQRQRRGYPRCHNLQVWAGEDRWGLVEVRVRASSSKQNQENNLYLSLCQIQGGNIKV